MHPDKLRRLLAQSSAERFDYLVRRVADFEEMWGLADDGWASCVDDSGQTAVPVWPEAELAAACATGDWAGMRPKPIGLADFLGQWIPGMERDKRLVAVFPIPSGKGAFVKPSQLGDALEEEKQQYE